MDRNNRESRRVTVVASNGLSRRRHRISSLRDSPEDDGPVDIHENARLRDQGSGKKDRDCDRDRDHDRDKERERDRERDRDRMSGRSKRRRGDRMLHGSNREDGGDDTSEESVNNEEDEDEDDGDGVGAGPGSSSMRMLPPNPSSISSTISNHHHHRKSFPPLGKVFKTGSPASPATNTISSAPWKAPGEMIGVLVPRRARSACTKRSHEWASSGAGIISGGEQIQRQTSTSPVKSTGPSLTAMLGSALGSPAPVSSPASSNASVKKKMKANGPKQRPPKSLSTKSTSLAQEEIEMEIAEVLYGLMKQPQAPMQQDVVVNDSQKFDLRELSSVKPSSADAKSSISFPISNTASAIAHSSILPSSNSTSPTAVPMSATAPKRKRPRPVKYEDEIVSVRNSPISSTLKVDNDQPPRMDSPLPNLENNSSANGAILSDLIANHAVFASREQQQPKAMKLDDSNLLSDLMPKPKSEESGIGTKEELRSPNNESPHGIKLDDDHESLTASKTNSVVSKIEIQREEKFQIDLMAPPPSRSSPERDSESDFVAVDPNAKITDVEMELKPSIVKEDDKPVEIAKEEEDINGEAVKNTKVLSEEVECRKPISNKERNIDVQRGLERTDRDASAATLSGNKLQLNVQKQQQPSSADNPVSRYVATLQGVVSMDGCSVPSAVIQPRPKRCATHCYLARTIHCQQQLMRVNPFWPAAAGTALQYGAKACNVPPVEMHAVRGVNSLQDKGQSLAVFPGHPGKDKNAQTSVVPDTAQRKQILLQQTIPPGAPNILHGPAFIFPLSQQQAASVRSGTLKSTVAAGTTASSQTSTSSAVGATASGLAGATAMSFNYPNMPSNETQYLAILQNGAYPIPFPAHVGVPPGYRGTHPQAMPVFNDSFYSSQMLHPSQLQQQQPPPPQSQQSPLGYQNPSISSGSSSSQKHLQSQQQLPHSSGFNTSSGNFQDVPVPKNQSSQSLQQLQQRQSVQNQNVSRQTRQLESELGGEDSPSTADSRFSHASMSHYGQNFAIPMPPNFSLMTPASVGGAGSANGNLSDKKQQPPQQQGSKAAAAEASPSHAHAMAFASINGAASASGIDMSSLAQNHALLQSLPEARRHSFHFMAAAASSQAAAQQKKNFRVSEVGKPGGNDAPIMEEERRVIAGGKASATPGHSFAFSRTDFTNISVSTMPTNSVIDNSARTLNHETVPARVRGPVATPAVSTLHATSVQQLHRNQQQQQQFIQLHKQHQFAAAATGRNKSPVTGNGSVYPDHSSSPSSMAAKFPTALSAFPQNLVQGSSSPGQSPQWKSSSRTGASPVSSSLTPAPSVKSPPQQLVGRNQQSHTHISFATNPKTSVTTQGQPPPSSNPSPSSSLVVGSPTMSSISKSASGSPRTSTSTNNKGGQSSNLSSQQVKNSPSVATQKSSPAGGRNIPSILGHHHNSSSSSSSASKSQLPQQQQLPKHTLQQAHMLYPGVYMQSQPHHVASSTTTIPAASGFYIQRHQSEHQQQPLGSSTSSGMLSMCPSVMHATTITTDPAKAVAAATSASNMKGGGLHSQGFIHAQFGAAQPSGRPHPLLPASLPYVHAVSTAIQVKQAEHKQPAGE